MVAGACQPDAHFFVAVQESIKPGTVLEKRPTEEFTTGITDATEIFSVSSVASVVDLSF